MNVGDLQSSDGRTITGLSLHDVSCQALCFITVTVLIPAGPALPVVDLRVAIGFSVFTLQVLSEVVSLPLSFLEKRYLVAFYDSAFSWFSFLPLSPI